MLKAVLFDLGWTLLDLQGCREFDTALRAELGAERNEIVRKRFVEAHRAPMDEAEWVCRVAEEIGASAEETEKLKIKIHWPRYALYADTVPALQALRAKGLKIGLVSNATLWSREALTTSGLRDYLDGIIVSCEMGNMKPEKEIFRAALAAVGAGPYEAVMVGDSLKLDVLGAEDAGIAGILLDRGGEEVLPDQPPGLRKIRSLAELETLLFP